VRVSGVDPNGDIDASSQSQAFGQHPQAAGFPNPFRGSLILREDLDSAADLIRQVLPLQQMGGFEPLVSDWWHCGLSLPVGNLALLAGMHPPLRITVAEQQGLTLFLGYGGTQRVQQGSKPWTCPPDGCLMLCGEAFAWESTLLSSVVLSLSPDRLLETAMAMAGVNHRPLPWMQSLHGSQGWSLSTDRSEMPLQLFLRCEISKIASLHLYSHALVDRLRIDDQIYRLMAALLMPELRQESPFDRLTQQSQAGRDGFDALIDYIKLNLSEPLSLTMLERESHYSRRALQYAFRERLDCTATQWIRSQRLDLARRHLQNPAPGASVASIATLCGYRSLSLFSVDFQQRFHVKPSQLLREARASQPGMARWRSSKVEPTETGP
jgi:AraC-like DNA-binding protein